MTHGQQRDLVVERHEALDDAAPLPRPAAGLGVVPGRVHPVGRAHGALAFARRRHHRLDHAGQADGGDGGEVLLVRVHEAVGRGRQLQRFRSKAADAFAVHRQARGARGGHHVQATLGFNLNQGLGVDGLDLGHHQVGFFVRDQVAQGGRVEHVQGVAAMRHLHRRRVVVAVGRDHLHAQPLQFDGHFLAQFARSKQQHAAGPRRKRCAQGDGARDGHGVGGAGVGVDTPL